MPDESKLLRGVEFHAATDGLVVRALAGSLGWQPILGVALSAAWAAAWGAGLARVVTSMEAGTAENPGPTLFLCALATLGGLYCVAFCLWTIFGHETLAIRRGRLSISNPWFFGRLERGVDLSEVKAFTCSGEACGVQPDASGCCCRWSSVDYALSFGHGGSRVSVFPQLPPATKEWLRDRLNDWLVTARSSGV